MNRRKIICFGDSNTYGYDPRGWGGRYEESVRWVDILAKHFHHTLEVIPKGMNGRMIPASTLEINNLDGIIDRESPVDFLAIMLGTNDLVLTDSPDWEMASMKMRTLLEHLLKSEAVKASGTKLILIAPPLMFQDAGPESPFRKYLEHSEKLAEAYRKIAEDLKIILVDSSAWNIEIYQDGVHLTEKGSLEFAEKIISALEEIIAEGFKKKNAE